MLDWVQSVQKSNRYIKMDDCRPEKLGAKKEMFKDLSKLLEKLLLLYCWAKIRMIQA